ncbi:hypothetical protein A1OE_441 [Candidatus Endolissoclinum faulkneri L2]|uniref:Uncharacterized protein n=1 Tax=Candidatus Endolissoclinum faulkneri L2 TaxID=1193729 RepID=K7YPY0_9PROT|nr:hypothetical protein A1OE_441 [Candidatus Endolissoclinum faulkneri L2]
MLDGAIYLQCEQRKQQHLQEICVYEKYYIAFIIKNLE